MKEDTEDWSHNDAYWKTHPARPERETMNTSPREDITIRSCARCGQNVNRLKDSFKAMPDGSVIHTSCPASEAMKNLPALAAGVSTEQVMRQAQAISGVTTEKAASLLRQSQFIRMEDAAKMLAVSVDTIRRRIRSGELPAKRLRGAADGGRQTILIDQADVLALLEPYTGAEA